MLYRILLFSVKSQHESDIGVYRAAMEKLFHGGSDSNESAYNVGDPGSIPELGRSPGEANGIPLQYSCMENPMDG